MKITSKGFLPSGHPLFETGSAVGVKRSTPPVEPPTHPAMTVSQPSVPVRILKGEALEEQLVASPEARVCPPYRAQREGEDDLEFLYAEMKYQWFWREDELARLRKLLRVDSF